MADSEPKRAEHQPGGAGSPGAGANFRRFRNNTERLEKLFDLHTKMAASQMLTRSG